MPRALDALVIPPRLPVSAGSWWTDVPRDRWRLAYEQRAPHLAHIRLGPSGGRTLARTRALRMEDRHDDL